MSSRTLRFSDQNEYHVFEVVRQAGVDVCGGAVANVWTARYLQDNYTFSIDHLGTPSTDKYMSTDETPDADDARFTDGLGWCCAVISFLLP